jgi:hypothetical protein
MLQFCDGMDMYSGTGTGTLLSKWTSYYSGQASGTNAWQFASGSGRFGGGALMFSGSGSGNFLSKTINSSYGSGIAIYAALHLKFLGGLTSGNPYAAGGGGLISLNGTGTPILGYYGSGGTAPGSLYIPQGANPGAPINVMDGNWHWAEVLFYPNYGGSGQLALAVDGQVYYNQSGLSIGNPNPVNSVMLGNGQFNSGTTLLVDDFILWDTSGSGAGNVLASWPLGIQRISSLLPSGSGSSTQWTPNTGANWAAVSGNYANANYVTDGTSGDLDLYGFAALPYTPATIRALVMNYYASQNVNGGSSTLIPYVKSSTAATSGTGSGITLGATGYANFQAPFYQDPGTAAPWVGSGVNSGQYGQKTQ